MFSAIGLDRSSVYITNVLFWRPPGNRSPTDLERAQCHPFVLRHIELVLPKILVLLGGVAASTLLGTTEGVTKIRGRWLTCRVGEREFRTLVSLHPAYLLRNARSKRLAWHDMLMLQEFLEKNAD